MEAKPFVKWAGGKGRLLEQYDRFFPTELKKGTIKTYVEPFVGGGAVFFHIVQKYHIGKAVLCDINQDLCNTYSILQRQPELLINILKDIQEAYWAKNDAARVAYFNLMRRRYNTPSVSYTDRAALFVFLNKTCYNGLYRTNSRGEFNAPIGRYVQPRILDATNFRLVCEVLKKTEILCGDFANVSQHVDADSFVYFDPPYRPISKTSSFSSFDKAGFGNSEQERLGQFFRDLDLTGAKLMLSNSNPKVVNPHDNFFDRLFKGFKIRKVLAHRFINSAGGKRGKISELLITNY
jgi:DNA adenine methylase